MAAKDRAKRAAMTGGITGGILGGAGSFLHGAQSIGKIAKGGGIGALLGGGAAGLSSLVGSSVLGEPDETESNPNLKRGLVGGLLLGGGLGAGLGALSGAGRLGKLYGALPELLKRGGGAISEELPLKNLLTDYLARQSGKPNAWKNSAAIGAAGLGLPMAYVGGDEGLGLDAYDAETEDKKKEMLLRQLMAQQGGGYGY